MSVRVYHIEGLSGPSKSVSLWHTNKHLTNFHWTLSEDVRRIYEDWPAGTYTFKAGYQNGYHEIGIAHVIVKTTEP